MNKKKIEAKYREDLKLIKKLNKNSFIESKPAVSDSEYDELKKI